MIAFCFEKYTIFEKIPTKTYHIFHSYAIILNNWKTKGERGLKVAE